MSTLHEHQPGRRAWTIVAAQELRDLWVGGRGPWLMVAYSALLSIIAYLAATNQALNFLEHRESVNLTLQVAIAVGALLTLLVGADAISGERERGTLECLLLSPVSRLGLTAGKLVGALSLWLAAFLITIPYVWFLARGVKLVDEAILTGFVVGTLLAVFLASLGVLVSVRAGSNRVSLSLSLFILLALFAPTQLPASAEKGWLGEFLFRANPITSGEHYVGRLLVDGIPWDRELSWLISPIVGAVVFAALAAAVGHRFMHLRTGGPE